MIRWVIGLALLAPPAFGCTCGTADVFKAPTLFIGEVIDGGLTSLREDPWNSRVSHVRFRVLENFRGLAANTQTVDVDLLALPGMCSPIPYFFGKQYLVLLSPEDGHFVDGPCFNGLEVTKNTQIVNRVRSCFSAKTLNQIQGIVTAGGPGCKAFSRRSCEEGKPLRGAVVSASKDGHVYRTATGSDGSYRLQLPGSGEYLLQAVLHPYLSQPPVQIAVGGDGCQVHDFVMRIDKTISGSVRDVRGKLVSDSVELIGSPPAFRRVKVSVRFPDGKPMKWARITCVGSPPEGVATSVRVSTNYELAVVAADTLSREAGFMANAIASCQRENRYTFTPGTHKIQFSPTL